MCFRPAPAPGPICLVAHCFSGTLLQIVRRQPLLIKCARVGGVEIPNQKRIEYSLQYIYGVGHTTAKAILVETVSTYGKCAITACHHAAVNAFLLLHTVSEMYHFVHMYWVV